LLVIGQEIGKLPPENLRAVKAEMGGALSAADATFADRQVSHVDKNVRQTLKRMADF